MNNVKRKSAVFGFTLLFSIMIYMLTDIKSAYILIPATAVLCIILLFRKNPSAYYFLIGCMATTIAALSLLWWNTHIYQPASAIESADCIVTGSVYDYPAEGESNSVILKNCSVSGNKLPCNIKIYYPNEIDLIPGDSVIFNNCSIYTSASGDKRFFYHSLSDKCWLTASSLSRPEITHSEKTTIYGYILKFRHYLEDKILSSDFPVENTSVICALLTGNKSHIPGKISSDFRKSGISHILAVSGMHLSIWSGVLFLLLRKKARSGITGNIVATVFVIFYCIFTGLSPSVLRAGIMLAAVYIAAIFRERSDPINALGIASSVLLLTNPWLGGNISFLLSFFATFAIVGFAPVISENKTAGSGKKIRNKLNGLLKSVFISLCVMFILFPFTTFFFGYISMLSPVASLLCSPLAEIIMIFSSISLIFPQNNILFTILFSITNIVTTAMLKLSSFFGSLPFGLLTTDKQYIKIWFIITVILLLVIFYVFRKSGRAMTITSLLSVAVLLVIGIINYNHSSSDIQLYVPGSYDSFSAVILADNGGTAIVTGCEGNYSSYNNIKNYLLTNGVTDIDMFFVPLTVKTEKNILPYFGDDFVCKDFIFPGDTDTIHRNEKFIYSPAVSADFADNINISYEAVNNTLKEIIKIKDQKIVILKIDKETIPEEKYRSGDILICYDALPADTDIFSFNDIRIITKNKTSLPQNASRLRDKEINIII